MTKDELIAVLRQCAENAADENDFNAPQAEHMKADDALLAFINDPEVTAVFESIQKWYA